MYRMKYLFPKKQSSSKEQRSRAVIQMLYHVKLSLSLIFRRLTEKHFRHQCRTLWLNRIFFFRSRGFWGIFGLIQVRRRVGDSLAGKRKVADHSIHDRTTHGNTGGDACIERAKTERHRAGGARPKTRAHCSDQLTSFAYNTWSWLLLRFLWRGLFKICLRKKNTKKHYLCFYWRLHYRTVLVFYAYKLECVGIYQKVNERTIDGLTRVSFCVAITETLLCVYIFRYG